MMPIFGSSSSVLEHGTGEEDDFSDTSRLLSQDMDCAVVSSQPTSTSRAVPSYGSLASTSCAPNITLSDLEIDRLQLKLVALIGNLSEIKESGSGITMEDRVALVGLERSLHPFLGDSVIFDVRAVQNKIKDIIGVSGIDVRLSVVEDWAEKQDPGSIHGVPQVDPSSRCYCVRRSFSYLRYSRRPIVKLCREIVLILGMGCAYDWFTFSCFKYCVDNGLDCLSLSKYLCGLIKSCIDKASG